MHHDVTPSVVCDRHAEAARRFSQRLVCVFSEQKEKAIVDALAPRGANHPNTDFQPLRQWGPFALLLWRGLAVGASSRDCREEISLPQFLDHVLHPVCKVVCCSPRKPAYAIDA